MPVYNYPISASFGHVNTGLIGSVGYTVVSADDVVRIIRTTSGISERADAQGNATTGIYESTIALNTDWGTVRVVWTIDGAEALAAEEVINAAVATSNADIEYQQALAASFGASRSGQEGAVGYKVLGADGSTKIARTTTGVSEREDALGNKSTGIYEANATFNKSWGAVRVVWDITDVNNVAAVETILASATIRPNSGTPSTAGNEYVRPYATNTLEDFYTVWDQLCAEVDFMKNALNDQDFTNLQETYFVNMYSPKIEKTKEMLIKSLKIMQDLNPQINLSKNQIL